MDTYFAPDPILPPLSTWSMKTMITLEITVCSRTLQGLRGSYYIVRGADLDIEYGYRVVGEWNDRTRHFTVPGLS